MLVISIMEHRRKRISYIFLCLKNQVHARYEGNLITKGKLPEYVNINYRTGFDSVKHNNKDKIPVPKQMTVGKS